MANRFSRARESVFPGGIEQHNISVAVTCPPRLIDCVREMENVVDEVWPFIGSAVSTDRNSRQMYEAQELLRNGTFDLPRMNKILQPQKVYC